MWLKIDEVAGVRCAGGAEEMVEADLEQVSDRSVGRDVSAEFRVRLIGASDHDQRVPAVNGCDPRFQVEVAGVGRLGVHRDGVAIGGGVPGVETSAGGATRSNQAAHQVFGARDAISGNDVVQAGEPVERFIRIDVFAGVGRLQRGGMGVHEHLLGAGDGDADRVL